MELKNDYQALIVSGDIYDRAIPPVEAVNLLSDFLNSIKEKFPHLHVFINSGNHDSSERLGFAKEILEAQNTDVDAFSGATYSSNGIKKAVLDALKQAGFPAN